jgi:hypothetical protein
MAKTDFQSGSHIYSPFMDSIYLTDGGHKHDGVDSDGHAGKIDLTSAAEVEGKLPLANQIPEWGLLKNLGIYRSSTVRVTVFPGACTDKTGVLRMTVGSQISKDINAVWTEGHQVGGRASGASLSNGTWYRLFLIAKSDGSCDAGFDTSASAANLLSDASGDGYAYYRHMAWVYYIDGTDGIRDFVFSWPATFLWATAQAGGGTPAVQTSVTTLKLPVPSDALALVTIAGTHSSQAWRIVFWDGVLGSTYKPGCNAILGASGGYDSSACRLLVSSSNIYLTEELATTGGNYYYWCRGFVDRDRTYVS